MRQLELIHSISSGTAAQPPRPDHAAIAGMVRDGAKVLDVGCGDGALMSLLARERGATACGLEIDPSLVRRCVSRGLFVAQGDAERELGEYPDRGFDFVVLSRTLQELRRPRAALKEAARVGDRVIVSIANAGHWRSRLRLMLGGRIAGAGALHPYSVRDFAEMARETLLTIERATPLAGDHVGVPFAKTLWRANWFAEEAVFLLAR